MEKLLFKIKKLIPRRLFRLLQPGYHFFLSWLAAVIYRRPSEELIVIGITGTTGKTTSAYLIARCLEKAGCKTGLSSTAVFNDGRKEWLNDKKMTMVGRFFTQRLLRRMAAHGCRYAVVETTSEGIKQYRHRFINYDLVIFTGLYPEHIEAHGSFENYKKAKGELFTHLSRGRIKYADERRQVKKTFTDLKKLDLARVKKTIIVNGDDENAPYFLDFWADRKIVYTAGQSAAENFNRGAEIIPYGRIEVTRLGTSFSVAGARIDLRLLGAFNVANAMNAVTVGLALDLDITEIKKSLQSIAGVAGRLERIDEGQNFTVIVDYAFEPGALAKLHEAIAPIPRERLIHVLGSAGGGRDVARRPILGELAGQKADLVIVTNEDPYDDDPAIIIDQVAFGAQKAGKRPDVDLFKIVDRRQAIYRALSEATENDLVLITGKGSEQAICAADGEKIPWDDRAVARGILTEKMDEKAKTLKK